MYVLKMIDATTASGHRAARMMVWFHATESYICAYKMCADEVRQICITGKFRTRSGTPISSRLTKGTRADLLALIEETMQPKHEQLQLRFTWDYHVYPDAIYCVVTKLGFVGDSHYTSVYFHEANYAENRYSQPEMLDLLAKSMPSIARDIWVIVVTYSEGTWLLEIMEKYYDQ